MFYRFAYDRPALASFCRRWKVKALSVFGSALREDFRPESDIDLLVDFDLDAEWSLLDHVAMQQELSGIFGRPVDLVSRKSVQLGRNWIRKAAILDGARPLDAAG